MTSPIDQVFYNEELMKHITDYVGKFRFQNKLYKNHKREYIIFDADVKNRPKLNGYWERTIAKMNSILTRFGKKFEKCIIVKQPWKICHWDGKFREKGVATNFTFITGDGELMWRKIGVGHGTCNKVYVKGRNEYYTTWMKKPFVM